ncbi:MAG: hypothetical protein OXH52_04605 [Gammaproteobacteria bacterium]|nr:hypothetical protein [Gammaproteobacteria bacterium]
MEGRDDEHAIKHLLLRHGVECPLTGEVPRDTVPAIVPEIKPAGDKDKVLATIEHAVKFGTGHSVGFVVDADEAAANSWHAVRDRLSFLDPKPPIELPATGFIADVPAFKVRVGVWLMPDNRASGALKHFLTDLIEENDPLLTLAYDSTTAAQERGATFPDAKYVKAVIHAWLSWQEDPGRPFGTAIKAKFFSADSPIALSFLQWFDKLFGTDAVGSPS